VAVIAFLQWDMEDTFDKFTCVPDEVEKTYEKSPYVVCAFVGYYV
jgi:hypothetical protein